MWKFAKRLDMYTYISNFHFREREEIKNFYRPVRVMPVDRQALLRINNRILNYWAFKSEL